MYRTSRFQELISHVFEYKICFVVIKEDDKTMLKKNASNSDHF